MSKKENISQNNLQPAVLEKTMITQNYYAVIQELYAKGTAKKAIARLLDIDIKTVRLHLKKETWQGYDRQAYEGPLLSENHRAWLMNRMEEVHYNGRVLWRELTAQGYKGSYETIKKFISPHRKKLAQGYVRYETEPGQQGQVDWGSAWVWLGDKRVKVHFLAFILGYSRSLFAKGYQNEQFINLVNGHEGPLLRKGRLGAKWVEG